jgi:uncharacterized damage-inducible protein DinB
MPIAKMFLAEYEQEASTTRRFLERLPEDKLTWKPHEKSMTAGELALHMALLTAGVAELARHDVAPLPQFSRPQPASKVEILEALDRSVAAVRSLLPTFDDDAMQRTWRLTRDGEELLAVPRAVFLRNIMLNHWIQHRGQFAVYLRLLGQSVPASYGPSADEAPEFLSRKPANA